MAQDLPRRILRERDDAFDRDRPRVDGEPLATKRPQFLLDGRGRSWLEHDIRDSAIRRRHNAGVGDRRVL